MKGKFKLLGHIGLVLFLLSALMLAVMPAAQAATAVTNVWVEFPYSSSKNATSSTACEFYIHFKPTTALVRGVDYVTVTFPDGSTAMGPAAFTAITGTVAAADLEFSTDYGTLGSDANWYRSTSNATSGGYRVKVLVPFDYAAGTDVWLRITSTSITSAATASDSYKVYVSTTKDTTPVLSSAFTLGSSVCTALSTEISPATAGAASQYTFTFTTAATTGALTSGTSTVTVKFPIGTVMPSSISASNVEFSAGGVSYTAAGTTPIVDTNKRTITATVSVTGIDAADTGYMRVLSGAGVINPTTASTTAYKCMILTSSDRQYFLQGSAHTVSAGTPTKVTAANGAIGLASTYYSDNATMINMYSQRIFLVLTDDNGNAKAPASAVTVSLSSSSASGAFYTNAEDDGSGAMTSATTVSLDAATPDAGQTVYYKDSASGTYTLTFTASGYTSATWTFTVAPGVSLYDASNNLVNTYAPTTTYPAAETATTTLGASYRSKVGSDYVNDAISAAIQGDTVKLGDGIYEMDNDSSIALSKLITLTSVNGASSTTLRPTEDVDKAITVTGDGTSTNPVIIDGFTFQRLRATVDIECAIWNDGYDYMTVRNCIFNNIEPDQNSSHEAVIFVRTGAGAIASCTISNNTFSSCVTTWPDFDGAKGGNIVVSTSSGNGALSGVTISGNTLTNCYGYGITIGGTSSYLATGSITNNTITNGYSSICVCDYISTSGLSITGNTITGAYSYGIKVEGETNGPITFKNNTITGCAGSYAIRIEHDPTGTDTYTHYIQYNDIYNNASDCYAIRVDSGVGDDYDEIDCKYNWYGDASGPNYTAVTGAKVTKSNPNGTGGMIYDRVVYYPWLHKSKANVVADNASYQAITIKLVSGWNTLSTPVKLISTADAIDELIPSGMTIGYYYDGGWQQITTGYVLNPCDAVYVKMSAATYVLFKIDASAFSTPSKSLSAGWNLIGLSYLASGGMDADDAVASVYLTAGGLPGYSQVVSPSLNAAQTDIHYAAGSSWTVSRAQHATDTSHMLPGLGYWIYMQNAATLAGFEITPIVPDLD